MRDVHEEEREIKAAKEKEEGAKASQEKEEGTRKLREFREELASTETTDAPVDPTAARHWGKFKGKTNEIGQRVPKDEDFPPLGGTRSGSSKH